MSYWALAGPALLWLGAGLLIWRLVDLLLGRGRRITAFLMRPLAGRIAPVLLPSMSRQRRPLVKAATVLALSIAFAISTATFNTTYQAQAEADAQLTNGADVTVTQSPGAEWVPPSPRPCRRAGVSGVEPLQHRYAYIGTDLQDLYGVRPDSIRSVTALQDSYFLGGSAAALMHTLQTKPDSILVSSETVKDYQLHLGDLINLRLLDGRTHQLLTVRFHYVGIVSEFPTAPKDSFFVTNAAYVAAQDRQQRRRHVPHQHRRHRQRRGRRQGPRPRRPGGRRHRHHHHPRHRRLQPHRRSTSPDSAASNSASRSCWPPPPAGSSSRSAWPSGAAAWPS